MSEAKYRLDVAAEKLLGFLINHGAEGLSERLRGKAVKKVLVHVLIVTVSRYATTSWRLGLAFPLLGDNGLLAEPAIAEELAQVVCFEREPSAALIGQLWSAALDNPPGGVDFTTEADLLLSYLANALRATEMFHPVFDTRSLISLDTGALALAELDITSEAQQLATLVDLIQSPLKDLYLAFIAAPTNIRNQIRDYSYLISEKTQDFVGREFVFDAIARFVEANPRGYFVVRGAPGVGKTALAAQLVKKYGYAHHFNIRGEGINTPEAFLRNICAQLIALYELKYDYLPIEATQDASFLSRLFAEISDKLGSNEKVIVVIDALDEADSSLRPVSANVLYLPVTIPDGIYIIATTRQMSLNTRFECEHSTLDIEQDSIGNIADVYEYVTQMVQRPGIQAYARRHNIDVRELAEYLATKSQGNFMYLRYVFPEIEHGVYSNLELDRIPVGLQNYYEAHWQRMRGQDSEAWHSYKLPVVLVLTVVKEPVSSDLIADFAGVQEEAFIYKTLSEWAPFLVAEQVRTENGFQKRYRVYHHSFRDFIAGKEEITDERVSLTGAHKRIADKLWETLFGNE